MKTKSVPLIAVIFTLIFYGCREENFDEDYTYKINEAEWSDFLDYNGDGYAQSGKLSFTVSLIENVTRSAYGRIYYKHRDASEYSYYSSTESQTIRGGEISRFETTIGTPNEELERGEYDFKIELYEKNGTRIEAVAEPEDSNFAALKNALFEKNDDDKIIDAETWWENMTDITGDGYARSGKLVLNVDCDSASVKTVTAKVYFKPADSANYAFLHEFGSFVVTGISENDTVSYFIGKEKQLPKNIYDFKIEIFDAANGRLAYMLDENNSSALNDVGFEKTADDMFYYSIESIRWSNKTDLDGDGFARSGILHFDVNVDKNALKNVYAKIYSRHPDSVDYDLYDSTSVFPIQGTSSADAIDFAIGFPGTALDSSAYDFLISVYQAENDSDFTFVAAVSSENDSVLADVKFETGEEDGGK